MRKRSRRKTFTNEIRRAILDAREDGWTRYALWKELGVSQGALGNFVAGRQGIGSDLLDRIADLLGLHVAVDPRQRKPAPKKKTRR